MWSTEESIETTASADAIWRLWADVPRWPDWNADIEHIELSGPFAGGSKVSMTPIGQEPVELRIEEAIEPELFIDVAALDDVVVRTIHRVERIDDDRNRVTYRMEITGPAADRAGPELGPKISGDFPRTLAALIGRAEP
jgi:Polyketide cyclase / dehydrase and lipid transport